MFINICSDLCIECAALCSTVPDLDTKRTPSIVINISKTFLFPDTYKYLLNIFYMFAKGFAFDLTPCRYSVMNVSHMLTFMIVFTLF